MNCPFENYSAIHKGVGAVREPPLNHLNQGYEHVLILPWMNPLFP